MSKFYTIKGKKYRRVTSVVSDMYPFDKTGYHKWCEMNGLDPKWITAQSNRIGTKVHDWLDHAISGLQILDEPVITEQDKMFRGQVEELLSKFDYIETERQVHTDDYMIAGTVDGVTKQGIVDIKTWGAWRGKVSSNVREKEKKLQQQLSMYGYMLGGEPDLFLAWIRPDGKLKIKQIEYSFKWKKYLDEI